MIVCFFLFSIEIILLSIVRPEYMFTFFFYMDVVSTLSLLIEVPMVMSGVLGISAFNDNGSAKIAK